MMLADAAPLLVVSDVHLNHVGSEPHSRELSALVQRSQGVELVLAGDIFDLSRDPPERDPAQSVSELLTRHAALRDALRVHLSRGNKLTLIAGNHDAAVGSPDVRSALIAALGVQANAPLQTEPWFIRRGRVHIEHGHLYDPDNAPSHPLAQWTHATEPLGIALTRRFLVPTGALALAHAHETTPIAALIRSVELFGPKAPVVVARYFATAIRLCIEAGRQRGLGEEREQGDEALLEFARQSGLSPELLREIVESRPNPTHHRFSDMFMRLYFDRVLATLSFGVAVGTAVARRSPTGIALATIAGAYLGRSLRTGKNRYSGVIEQRLREAALSVAEKTDAELVIFGHTHRVDRAERYLNSGSFAYGGSGGRPYVWVDPAGRAEHRRLTA